MSLSRRELLGRLGLATVGLGGLAWLQLAGRSHAPTAFAPGAARRGVLRPPGSLPEDEFLARCIRCQRCVEACEPRAIRLVGGESAHAGTPVIVAEERACNLCLRCGPACPTGAIAILADRSDAAMGEAIVDEDLCVSHNGSGVCGACFTACPLKGRAIVQGIYNAPEVRPEHCVGCGLCEEACIVHRDKAIRVHSGRSWS